MTYKFEVGDEVILRKGETSVQTTFKRVGTIVNVKPVDDTQLLTVKWPSGYDWHPAGALERIG